MFDFILKQFENKKVDILLPSKMKFPKTNPDNQKWFGNYYIVGIYFDGCNNYISVCEKDEQGFFNTPYDYVLFDEVRFSEK